MLGDKKCEDIKSEFAKIEKSIENIVKPSVECHKDSDEVGTTQNKSKTTG